MRLLAGNPLVDASDWPNYCNGDTQQDEEWTMPNNEKYPPVGSRIMIASWDLDQRRELEAHGFVMESGDMQNYTMRRDFEWAPSPLFG